MSIYYLDTSALAKRYLRESGSRWVDALMDPAAGNRILTAEIARVEVAAALAARSRAPSPASISRVQRDRMLALVAQHFQREYVTVRISAALIDRAAALVTTYRLRGYDAVHVAAALTVNGIVTATGAPAIIVVASDQDLLVAAQGEGLPTDNPAAHP